MSYIYEGGKMYTIDRDGDRVCRGEYDIEAEDELKNRKLCPFRSSSTTYHSNKKNYLVPEMGINKMMNYDVTNTELLPCIKEECMAYDTITGECKRLK